MLELLNPSLPGAARALASIARFRVQVAVAPRSKQFQLIAQRFMSPSGQDKALSVQRLMADLRRFAPDWQHLLGNPANLEVRLTALLGRMRTSSFASGANTVALYRWDPAPTRGKAKPQRHVLLSHGWESYALSYALVIERLLDMGCTVHAVDHVAHGASNGEFSGLPRFAEVLVDASAHLAAQGIQIDLAVGHSLGAGAWLMATTKLGLRPKRMVLLAPFIDTPELLGKWLKLHGLSENLRPGMQQAMLALHGPTPMAFDDMATQNIAKRLNIPTQVIQDPKDFIAPMRHARQLAELSPHIQCTPVPGAGHVGVLFHPETLNALSKMLGEVGE